MGIFDGEPSSADLAARFNIPLVIVMDVKGMAQTAAAVAIGLANFRKDVKFAGLIANNCGSDRHRQLIADALPEQLPLLAHLKRDETVALPERHLGLVQASEVTEELELRFEAGADWLQEAGAATIIDQLQVVDFFPAEVPVVEPLLKNTRIGIARDQAFTFAYQSNIRLLEALGADIHFFSPLKDKTLPEVDALWLPGGYPELHTEDLSNNRAIINQINDFYRADKPILAECGGLLYCLQTLTDLDDNQYPMAGLLEGHGAMRGKRGCQGMQVAPLPEGDVRAHAHHRSRSEQTPAPIAHGVRQRHPAPGEAIYRQRKLTATYLHLFFPSNPEAIATVFSNSDSVVHVGQQQVEISQ